LEALHEAAVDKIVRDELKKIGFGANRK